MTSKTGKETITIHMLLDISRNKGTQTMKFGQLIEYNMGNNFLEKSGTKCGGKAIPKPFSKIQNIYLCISRLIFIQFSFYFMLSRDLLKYIETKVLTTCFYII